MFRCAKATTATRAPPHYNSEVNVQKVEKIELVRNLVTKPSMYYGANPRSAAGSSSTMRRGAADNGASNGRMVLRPGVVCIEDINKRSEAYIRERKKLFIGLN